MILKPNTTLYLLADTGMSWDNSIWWDKYAYQAGPKEYQGYWHHVKGLWFKAHSCSEGYWYLSEIKVDRGVVRVGRVPLNDKSIPLGEPALSGEVNTEEYRKIPYADLLLGRCDYLYFTNGYDNDASRQYFAFVDSISSIDYNCAEIRFTIDAIQTYGEYFNFGPCMVNRDMQHLERAANMTPIQDNDNFEPEPISPQAENYVFQRISDSQEIIEKSNLGKYDKMFCMSDVSLSTADIRPNEYYGGLPSFKLSPESREGTVSLGVGGYYMPTRRCEVLDLLGSYNAIEHLLYTYLVPDKLVNVTGSDNPVMIGDFANILQDGYKGEKEYELKTPISFSDDLQTDSAKTDGYVPVNVKCYHTPYTYVSIADGQGSSQEIELQNTRPYNQTSSNYYNLNILLNLSAAPNVASCLYVKNKTDQSGGLYDPLLTLWQMPSYSMTPNNSGYNNDAVEAVSLRGKAVKQIAVGVLGGALAYLSPALSAVGLGGVGGFIGNVGAGLSKGVNAGFDNLMSARDIDRKQDIKETFGLPKAMGGMAQGFTRFNMQYAGYQYFFVHLRTELLKIVDRFFSIYGYSQNSFRYPHINTRRRWTFVQCSNVNIIDKGHQSAVPMWAKNQIQQRLSAGVTFWNVRWALLGDGDKDADPHSITDYTAGAIQANKGHRFVGNYGNLETMDYAIENMSLMGGYCADYTDWTPGLPEPD